MLTPNLQAYYGSMGLSFFPLAVTEEREVWLVHFFCAPKGNR
jgi:hypothetical protein